MGGVLISFLAAALAFLGLRLISVSQRAELAEIDTKRAKIQAAHQERVAELFEEVARDEARRCRYYRELANSQSTSQFSKQQLHDLVSLCHPDKHGNSQKSNEVTA